MHKRFLLPSEYAVVAQPTHVRTILGSCVSVCLLNRRAGVFGINHFMLPDRPAGSNDTGRYGDSATEAMFREMCEHDAALRHYEAQVFGGAAVVGELSAAGGVGERNIAVARAVLRRLGVRVVEEAVGGEAALKVDLHTDQGRASWSRVSPEAVAEPPKGPRLRVLIVDDSAVTRAIIRRGLSSSPQIDIVGEAVDPFDAREKLMRLRPDVLTLDLEMPRMDGDTFLKQLMKHFPLPVVVVSASAPAGSERCRRLLQSGAQAVVDKGDLDLTAGADAVQRVLLPRIKLAGLGRLAGVAAASGR